MPMVSLVVPRPHTSISAGPPLTTRVLPSMVDGIGLTRTPAWRVPIEPALVPAGGPCRFLSGDARLHHRKRGASLRFEGRNPQPCRRGARLIRDGIESRFAVRAFVEVCLIRRRQRQRLVIDPTQRSVTQVSHDLPPCAEPLPLGAAAFPRFQP